MNTLSLTIKPLGDSAILVEIGDPALISRERSGVVTTLANRLLDQHLPGVVDIVPAYTTILVSFDLMVADPDAIADAIRFAAADLRETALPPLRRVTIPVCYDTGHGPDLVEFARLKERSCAEIISLHTSPAYFVACMGFSPGWAYLLGLPEELAMPRRSTPRVRVPAGSVAIGGGQTGVYPTPTPGGWWLLGQTPARLFDPRLPDPFVLRPGDEVRFVPIDEQTFAALLRDVAEERPVVQVEHFDGN